MAHESWEAVWARVRAGQHAVVIGAGPLPPAPQDLSMLHVHCAETNAQGGVMAAVQRHLERLLGDALSPAELGSGPAGLGVRHRLLDDLPGPSLAAQLVEACNRLADHRPGHLGLLVEAIDAADSASVRTLAQMLQPPGWLRLPLLVTVRSTPQGAVAELVYLLCHEADTAAVFDMPVETAPEEAASPYAWRDLPPEVLRVLRAGAVIGTTFEATLVARLLDEPVGVVLERLQWAVDAGVPLVDRGEGRFVVAPATISALQCHLTPSLLSFWHARLGELLRERSASVVQTPRPAPVAPYRDVDAADLQEDVPPQPPLERYAALFAPTPQTWPAEPLPSLGTMAPTPAAGAPRQRDGWARPTADVPGNPTRAAAHLQAAGRAEEAVAQYLAAIREVAAHGDTHRAYALTEQALQLLDTLPPSRGRTMLHAQLWLERGRLQWHGMLAGAPFTLQDALVSVETATTALPPDAPAVVRGDCAAVSAGICYDLGDMGALHRALAVLTACSQRLMQAHEPHLAARLLNDQAAIYVRLGDPGRATHFLAQSRALFEGVLRQDPHDRVAMEELAETDHLLARLPLHAPLRAGCEAESIAVGLEHARAAAQAYEPLGQHHHLARVWETMGRLALQGGQLAQAQEHLTAAHTLQQQLGDVTGLARSTAALADLCLRAGQWEEAMALLAASMELNVTKGSPIGLAFNRRALHTLAQASAQAPGADEARWRSALQEIEGRLVQAESLFGRMALPGEYGNDVAGLAARSMA